MSTIVRWNPLRDLDRLGAEFGRPRLAPPAFSPDLDVVERDGRVIVRADLPGVTREDVNVEVHEGKLTISGERKHDVTGEDDRFWHFERSFGAFRRTLSLPRGIDESSVSATYTDGVLEVSIELPKKPEPARIAIQ